MGVGAWSTLIELESNKCVKTPDQEDNDRAALREAWSSGALSSSGSISDPADPSLPRLLTNKSNKLEVQEGERSQLMQNLHI